MPFHICAERKIHILIDLILSGLSYIFDIIFFLFSSWLLLCVAFFSSFLKEVRPRSCEKYQMKVVKKKTKSHAFRNERHHRLTTATVSFRLSLLYGNVYRRMWKKDVGQVSTPLYPKHVIIIVVRKINIYAFWMMIEPSKRPHQSSSFYYTTSGSFLLLASGEPDQDFFF
jgi:hypothetical protein